MEGGWIAEQIARHMDCPLCKASVLRPDDAEWLCDPFCWKCGSYLEHEGNRWGWSAELALSRARRFDWDMERRLKRALTQEPREGSTPRVRGRKV